MRCLTLAQQARARGVATHFACRDLPGHIAPLISAQGFEVTLLPPRAGTLTCHWQDDALETREVLAGAQADWLIVDHYRIDSRWEAMMRPHARRILAIDDLADRPHDCDVLLDQNYHSLGAHRYDALVPPGCTVLLGPPHVLLRDEFHAARKALRRHVDGIRRILVNFGGTDETNVTAMAISGLQALRLDGVAVDVVIGATNPHHARLQQQIAGDAAFRLHVQASNMADLIAAADLAVGACGSSAWERCYLGLPSLTLVLADNQREAAEQLANAEIIINMGDAAGITQDSLAQAIGRLARDKATRAALSSASLALMPSDVPALADMLLEKAD